MTKLETKLKKRVALGAKWLTKNDGDWVKNTDLDKLDMSSVWACMLGQAFGQFWNKVYDNYVLGVDKKDKISENKAISLGFQLSPEDSIVGGFDILSKLWTKKIQRMRKARAATKKKRV